MTSGKLEIEEICASHAKAMHQSTTLYSQYAQRAFDRHFTEDLFSLLLNDEHHFESLRSFFQMKTRPNNRRDLDNFFQTVKKCSASLLNRTQSRALKFISDLGEVQRAHFVDETSFNLKSLWEEQISQHRHATCDMLTDRIRFLEADHCTRVTMILNQEAKELAEPIFAKVLKLEGEDRIGESPKTRSGVDVNELMETASKALNPDVLAKMSSKDAKEKLLASHEREKRMWTALDNYRKLLDTKEREFENSREDFRKQVELQANRRILEVEQQAQQLQTEINRLRLETRRIEASYRYALDVVKALDERCVRQSLQLNALIEDAKRRGDLSDEFMSMEHELMHSDREVVRELEEAASKRKLKLKNMNDDRRTFDDDIDTIQLKSAKSGFLPTAEASIQQQELIKGFLANNVLQRQLEEEQRIRRHLEVEAKQLKTKALGAQASFNEKLRETEKRHGASEMRMLEEMAYLRKEAQVARRQAKEVTVETVVSTDSLVEDLSRKLRAAQAQLKESTANEALHIPIEKSTEKAKVTGGASNALDEVRESMTSLNPTLLEADIKQPSQRRRPNLGIYSLTDQDAVHATAQRGPHSAVTPRARQLKAAYSSMTITPRPPKGMDKKHSIGW